MSDTDKTTHKYGGSGFIPGVPARDLTQEDLDGLGEAETELLREDAERESPMFKHVKNLGHSARSKAERAAKKPKEA